MEGERYKVEVGGEKEESAGVLMYRSVANNNFRVHSGSRRSERAQRKGKE